MIRKAFIPIILLVLISACALPSNWRPPGTTLEPMDGGTLTPPDGALKAQIDLANELGIAVDDVRLIEIDSVEWDDTCLDAAKAGEVCSQTPVPGLVVVMAVNADIYTYHTDMVGENIRWIGGSIDPSPVAEAAVQRLAEMSGVKAADIRVLSETPATFTNACLDVVVPGLTCAPVTTTGLNIRLDANGKIYIFRGTENSTTPILASVNQISSTTAVISWSNQGAQSEYCDSLVIYLNGAVLHYGCQAASGREPGVYTLAIGEQQKVLQWFLNGQSFEFEPGQSSGVEGRLVFTGIGTITLQPVDQLEMLHFTADLYQNRFVHNLPTRPPATAIP